MHDRWIQRSWRRALSGGLAIGLVFTPALILLTLLGAQAALLQRDGTELQRYTQHLLSHAEAVAGGSTDVLRQVAQMVTDPCSPRDLAELRTLAFHSQQVRDIGRLEGNTLICSAAWGVLDRPATLPPPDRTPRGFRLWTAVSNVVDPRVRADMAALGDVIVTTAPGAFDQLPQLERGSGALLTTRDSRHVYQRFGHVEGLATDTVRDWSLLRGERTERACSETFDICAIGRGTQTSVLALAWPVLLGLLVLGGLAGSGLGFLLAAHQRRRGSMPMQLRRALRRGSIDVVYQPLRRLDGRHLLGVEALARWRDEDGQQVRPDIFVAMAEQQHLTGALSRHVVRRVLGDLGARLRDTPGFYVSINLTAAEVVDPAFHAFLNEQTRASGVDPDRLVLEITERSTTAHTALARCMARLRGDGYRFYIDDFGTGFSNFAYLAELPVDAIKIDGKFTRAIGTHSPVSQIIGAICTMASALQIQVIVECVETEVQADYLKGLGVNAIGQGWLLGYPVAATALPHD